MKKVTINREKIHISAKEERVIRQLRASGFIASLSAFDVGRGRGSRNEARDVATESKESPVGVRIWWREAYTMPVKVRAWFERHPRNRYVVTGNPRRIKAILAKLDSRAPQEQRES